MDSICGIPQACQNRVRKFEMPLIDKSLVQNNLSHLVEVFGNAGTVKIYSDLAVRLSRMANRNGNAWTWRYVKSVHTGTVEPSKNFAHAVEVLSAETDGMPAFVADTEPVTVHARRGSVRANSIVLGLSKACANPRCTIHFIGIVPWQKYCPRCRKQKQS